MVVDNVIDVLSDIKDEDQLEEYRQQFADSNQITETLVRRNWMLGKMIAEEELKGEDRAKYGATINKYLKALHFLND